MFDVAICGYGPTGVLSATLLAQRGHRVLALERGSRDVYPLPRAVAMDAEVLRSLQGIGVADRLVENMLELPGAEFVTASGERIMGYESPSTTALGWAPTHIYHQPQMETLLRENAERFSTLDVRYGYEVTSFSQTREQVSIEFQDSDGNVESAQARYLLGCDGAASLVRQHGEFGHEDLDFDQDWLVTDLILTRDVDLPKVTQQICDAERRVTFVPGVGVPGVRAPGVRAPGVGHRVRWELQLKETETWEEMQQPARVFELLRRWLSEEDAELERAVVYRFHATLAQHWRRGRCFVLGDAAHQMPPFMGQGLCSGARDAFNLCWKLDFVLRGLAGDSLLESYEVERRPHAADTIDRSVMVGKLIDAFAAAAEGGELPRPEDAQSGYGGKREQPYLTGGLLVPGPGRLVGRPCPQPWVTKEGSRRRLDDLLGPGFSILARTNPDPLMNQQSRDFWRRIEGSLVALPEGSCDPDFLAPAFENHEAIVVRPDRCVFAATSGDGGGERESELNRAISLLREGLG